MTHRVVGLEHVGIAVTDVDAALALYGSLGFEPESIEELEDQGIRSHIIRNGDVRLELLESVGSGTAFERFLERQGPGLHHLCLQVESLDDTLDDGAVARIPRTAETPTLDARGTRVFLHPRGTQGVMTGLVEVHAGAGDAETPRAVVDPGLPEFEGKTYVPAVARGGRVLCTSGLNAIGDDGQVVAPGDVVGQCRAIYEKLDRILAAAGATRADVVKTTDYIVDRAGFAGTAEVRRAFFGTDFPASTGVVVKELLGRGVLIEIEALVVIPGGEA